MLGGWLAQSPKTSEPMTGSFQLHVYSRTRPSLNQRAHTSSKVLEVIEQQEVITPIRKAHKRHAHMRRRTSICNPPKMLASRKAQLYSATLVTELDDSPRPSISSGTSGTSVADSVSSAATSVIDDISNTGIKAVKSGNQTRNSSLSAAVSNCLADLSTSVADGIHIKSLFSRGGSDMTSTRSRENSVSFDVPLISPSGILDGPKWLAPRRSATPYAATAADYFTQGSQQKATSGTVDYAETEFSNPFASAATYKLFKRPRQHRFVSDFDTPISPLSPGINVDDFVSSTVADASKQSRSRRLGPLSCLRPTLRRHSWMQSFGKGRTHMLDTDLSTVRELH